MNSPASSAVTARAHREVLADAIDSLNGSMARITLVEAGYADSTDPAELRRGLSAAAHAARQAIFDLRLLSAAVESAGEEAQPRSESDAGFQRRSVTPSPTVSAEVLDQQLRLLGWHVVREVDPRVETISLVLRRLICDLIDATAAVLDDSATARYPGVTSSGGAPCVADSSASDSLAVSIDVGDDTVRMVLRTSCVHGLFPSLHSYLEARGTDEVVRIVGGQWENSTSEVDGAFCLGVLIRYR